jgi:phage-related protein
MKKNVFFDKRAKEELQKFSYDVQFEFGVYIKILEEEGKLDYPHAKKITKELFEIRVKVQGEYRGLYVYIGESDIIILHCFSKKTQKTPIKDLQISQKRMKYYE